MNGLEVRICSASMYTNDAHVLRTLNVFAVNLMQISDVDDLFWYVAQQVVGKLNFVDCVIYQSDLEGNSLEQVAAWGGKNPFDRVIQNPLKIPFGKGITGKTAQQAKPIIVDDLLHDQNYIADTEPARSEICVPIFSDGRVVGVIDSEHPKAGAFGAAELEILTTIAAMTGAKFELLLESQRSVQRYQQLVESHEQLTREIGLRRALEMKHYESRRMESIGRFTGKFAHQFNNILTAVMGNLELIDEAYLPQDLVTYRREAVQSGMRGAQMIRDMLAFAQRARLEPKELNINSEIVDFLISPPASALGQIATRLQQNVWPISADRNALRKILVELTKNARDAAASGEIVISTEAVTHTLSNNRLLTDSLNRPGFTGE